jgi:hypothetical protein
MPMILKDLEFETQDILDQEIKKNNDKKIYKPLRQNHCFVYIIDCFK